MTEIERLHLENDAVILRASNYLLRDQLAPRLSEDPVALQNAIGIPATTARRTPRLGM